MSETISAAFKECTIGPFPRVVHRTLVPIKLTFSRQTTHTPVNNPDGFEKELQPDTEQETIEAQGNLTFSPQKLVAANFAIGPAGAVLPGMTLVPASLTGTVHGDHSVSGRGWYGGEKVQVHIAIYDSFPFRPTNITNVVVSVAGGEGFLVNTHVDPNISPIVHSERTQVQSFLTNYEATVVSRTTIELKKPQTGLKPRRKPR